MPFLPHYNSPDIHSLSPSGRHCKEQDYAWQTLPAIAHHGGVVFRRDVPAHVRNGERFRERYPEPQSVLHGRPIGSPYGDHRTSADAVNVPQPALELGDSRQQHRGIARFLGGNSSAGGNHRQRVLEVDIPHHAGAILMCEKAEPKDPEIKKLCADIIASQQAEIE